MAERFSAHDLAVDLKLIGCLKQGALDSFSATYTFESCRDEGSALREIHNREKHGAASDIAPAVTRPGLHFFGAEVCARAQLSDDQLADAVSFRPPP
jgi:hypothetical protein